MRIITQDLPRKYRQTPELDSFVNLPIDPSKPLKLSSDHLHDRDFPRNALVDILTIYNNKIGNDEKALANIELLKEGNRYCIVTGQQLGLLGGPSYTILKAITCLLLAKQYHAIPIFWLATEDHDVSEIDHTYLLDSFGNINSVQIPFPKDGQPVEDLFLNDKGVEVIQNCLNALKINNFNIPKGSSYCHAMATLLAKQFAGTGLVFLEPRLLRPLAKDFFKSELIHADTIHTILKATTARLLDAGGHAPIALDSATNLFMKVNGSIRKRIIKKGADFVAGGYEFSLDQLLKLIDSEPHLFSPNVAARPVLQNMLLPAMAYVAGHGEIAYHHQLLDYHRFHQVNMPWIVPRLSATLIPPLAAAYLDACDLRPWEEIPSSWEKLFPMLPKKMEILVDEWCKITQNLFQDEISPELATRFVRQSSAKLHRKINKAILRKQGIPPHALHLLHHLIHPHQKLQERVLNWWGLQAQIQEPLINAFLKHNTLSLFAHHYCFF